MFYRNFQSKRRIVNKSFVVFLACAYLLVNLISCTGLKINGVAIDNTDHSLYAQNENYGMDGSGDNQNQTWLYKHWRELVLLGLAVFIGGVLIYIADEQNDDKKTNTSESNNENGLPPKPIPPVGLP